MLTPVQQQALDWLGLMYSGRATKEDIANMERWCSQSPDHAEALELARRIQRFSLSHESLADEALTPVPLYERATTRRLALMGLVAGAVGYGLVQPPLGIWPSYAEMSSDYRTKVGQQQKIALASGLSLQLNTRTSVSLRNKPGQPGIEVIAGEVAVSADLPAPALFVASTGGGQIIARRANFLIRKIDTGFVATCADGAISVTRNKEHIQLTEGQSVDCATAAGRLGTPYPVDTTIVTAWRHGQLVFHDAPLRSIVAEINRYRRGEIILVNSNIGNRRLSGSFWIKNLDDAATHFGEFAHVSSTSLPGGIVLLS